MRREARAQRLGRYAYWLFVYGVLAVALLTVVAYVHQARATAVTWQDVLGNLVSGLLSSNWVGLVFETLWQHKLLVVWLFVTWWVATSVDDYLDRHYSEFWHADDIRRTLRRLIGLG